MKVTTKGQVTIPKWIRDRTGVSAGSELAFSVDDENNIVARKVRGSERARRIVEHMEGRGDVDMSTDEILALMRGED